MELAVYADESGTHDETGQQPGSSVAVLVACVASSGEWEAFCREWQEVLNEFKVPYFHFCEFVRSEREKKGSICYGWDDRKFDVFLHKLADIAGRCPRFAFAASSDIDAWNRLTVKSAPPKGYIYSELIRAFYQAFLNAVRIAMPGCTETFRFEFDQTKNLEWQRAVRKAHVLFKRKEPKIADISFSDFRRPQAMPLQCADLYAYRTRQVCETETRTGQPQTLKPLDALLMQKLLSQPGFIQKLAREARTT